MAEKIPPNMKRSIDLALEEEIILDGPKCNLTELFGENKLRGIYWRNDPGNVELRKSLFDYERFKRAQLERAEIMEGIEEVATESRRKIRSL